MISIYQLIAFDLASECRIVWTNFSADSERSSIGVQRDASIDEARRLNADATSDISVCFRAHLPAGSWTNWITPGSKMTAKKHSRNGL